MFAAVAQVRDLAARSVRRARPAGRRHGGGGDLPPLRGDRDGERHHLDCAGTFVNDRGSGPADFAFSASLQEASVAGTITTRGGRTVTVDMSWEGTGEMETTSNTTTFPGFTGHFKGKRRDAVATGTVVVDGETLVDGSTTNAEIETLEDNNIPHP
jgi:hypothetical protein